MQSSSIFFALSTLSLFTTSLATSSHSRTTTHTHTGTHTGTHTRNHTHTHTHTTTHSHTHTTLQKKASKTSTASSATSISLVNPIKVLSKQFLGNVTSSNTPDVRDLGFQGQIGSTYINTFGDTVSCKSYQVQCIDLLAPNSAGVVTSSDSILQYTDTHLNPGGHHAAGFCPPNSSYGETGAWGMGLTNVIETGENEGIVFFVRNNRTHLGTGIVGSGVAHVTIDSHNETDINCVRPEAQWWGADEPWFADHGAILGQDGFVYAFGGARNVSGVFLARVPQHRAKELAAYEYWNGTSFSEERLHHPSTDAAVFEAGQGSPAYSQYYGKYMYIKPDCFGVACFTVRTADSPEGPWSTEGVEVFGNGDTPDHYDMYAPVYQPKWSDPQGKYMVLWYTGWGGGFGNVIQSVNITFA